MLSILSRLLLAMCLETIDACIWRMLDAISVIVMVWGSVGMFVVYRGCFISRDQVKCKVCLCSGCDGRYVFCLSCDACSCRYYT